MKRRSATLFLVAAIWGGKALAQCTPYDQLPALPSGLGNMVQELAAAVNGQCEIYKWRVNWTTNNQNFVNFDVGSQNLPVVGGAIGLIRDTNKAPAVNFFTNLLTCQTTPGSCTAANGHPSITHFKGKEILSDVYDYAVVDAVLVVNWWAHRNPGVAGAQNLQYLARLYLRKTWSLYALAAGRSWARELYEDNTLDGFNTGNGCGQAVIPCNIRINNGTIFFTGPFLALAGLRSHSEPGQRPCYDDRAVQFAYAINWNNGVFTNKAENASQASIRNGIRASWPGNVYGESVFALNSGEEQLVKDHILGNVNYADTFTGVIGSNGTRFYVPMHFIGWADGSRLSYLEYHENNNPGGTVYAMKFEPGSQRAHVHYPFHGAKNGPYRTTNRGQVTIGSNINPSCGFPFGQQLETWNQPCDVNTGDCKHEERRLWMPLPASTKVYEVVVDSAGARRVF